MSAPPESSPEPASEHPQSKHCEGQQLLLDIHRPVYDQDHFDDDYGVVPDVEFGEVAKKCFRRFACSRQKAKKSIKRFIPAIQWIRRYNVRQDLVADVVAGISVGIITIPQGMAYGILSGLPAVNGLYTSLFPSLLYAIFGTSRQMSVGAFSITSLMIATAIMNAKKSLMLAANGALTFCTENDTFASFDSNETNIARTVDSTVLCLDEGVLNEQIGTSLCMLVGLIMIVLGFLHFGFLSSYMSDQLVQGFTTGAAFHVLTSQVGGVLGLRHMPSTDSAFGLAKYYVVLMQRLGDSNAVAVIGSLCCIMVLYLYKNHLNDLVTKKIKFTIPIDLAVIIFATIGSYVGKFYVRHQIAIVGEIPVGIPPPVMPRFDLMEHLITDAIMIALITYSVSVSMAKLFAKQFCYRVAPNQEWYALGIASAVSSVFSSNCCCGSLSVSAARVQFGGKTQLTAVIASMVLVAVLLFVAPYCEHLPKFALSSLIIVNLKGLLMQLRQLKPLWIRSRIDFVIWIISFGAVIVLNVTFGLAVAVVGALLTVIIRSQWPESQLLGKVPKTDIYKGLVRYKAIKPLPGVMIFRFDAPLFFANTENFKSHLYEAVELEPLEYKRKLAKYERAVADYQAAKKKRCEATRCIRMLFKSKNVVGDAQPAAMITQSYSHNEDPNCRKSAPVSGDPTVSGSQPGGSGILQKARKASGSAISMATPIKLPQPPTKPSFHHIILDCSSFPYVDEMGVSTLRQIYEEYDAIGITTFFATCRVALRHSFDCSNFYEVVPKHCLFLTVHDAVLAALSDSERQLLDQE